MPTPTFVGFYDQTQSYEFQGGAGRTIGPFDVLAGDLIVVRGFVGDQQNQLTTPSASGGSVVWTLETTASFGAFAEIWIWSGLVGASANGITISSNVSPSGDMGAFNARLYRNHNGVGAKASNTGNPGVPVITLTGLEDNSAVVFGGDDWNAADGASRAWLSTTIEDRYGYASGTQQTVYCGYNDDIGTGGTKTFGLTAPTGQKWSASAVEVKGLAVSKPGVLLNGLGHPIITGNGNLILI